MLPRMGGVRRRALVLAATIAAAVVLALALLVDGSPDQEEPKPAPPQTTAPAPRPPVDVRAAADLGAAPKPAASMSGFLHSLSETSPPDDVLSRSARGCGAASPRRPRPGGVARLGARYQLVLSDLWGQPGNGERARPALA